MTKTTTTTTTTGAPRFLDELALQHLAEVRSERLEESEDFPTVEEHSFEVVIDDRRVRVATRIHSAGTESWDPNVLATVIWEIPEADAILEIDRSGALMGEDPARVLAWLDDDSVRQAYDNAARGEYCALSLGPRGAFNALYTARWLPVDDTAKSPFASSLEGLRSLWDLAAMLAKRPAALREREKDLASALDRECKGSLVTGDLRLVSTHDEVRFEARKNARVVTCLALNGPFTLTTTTKLRRKRDASAIQNAWQRLRHGVEPLDPTILGDGWTVEGPPAITTVLQSSRPAIDQSLATLIHLTPDTVLIELPSLVLDVLQLQAAFELGAAIRKAITPSTTSPYR